MNLKRNNIVEYSISQLSEIKSKIFAKIAREIELANKNDEMQALFDKYGIYFEEEAMQVDTRTMKVLVLGALAGRVKDYKLAVKKMDINPDNVEFIDTYDDKRFNVAKLEYSMEYSDIIYGPNPHKQVGMGDTNSFLAEMKRNPERYPRVIEAVSNDKLKITISGFKKALSSTRFFETLSE